LKVGLALGGGSARGVAHIGVIDALVEEGIPIDIVAGTSIGAMVGAGFAAGKHEELKEFALSLDKWKLLTFFDPSNPFSGLVEGKKVTDYFGEKVGYSNIEDLPLRFAAVCCDYATGERVVLDHGPIVRSVRASMSVPGLFTPARVGGKVLIDGGVVEPVPVRTARELGADVVIAVDLNTYVLDRRSKNGKGSFGKLLESRLFFRDKEIPDVFSLMMDSLYIMQRSLSQLRLKEDRPEVIISPKIGDVGFMDYNMAPDVIRMGREQTLAMIDRIRKAIS